jgi:hypothetical protein
MAGDQKLVSLAFGQGVANRVAATKLPKGFVIGADNVDFSDSGVPSRRAGFTELAALAGAHSFCTPADVPFGLVADATTLYSVHLDGSLKALVTGLDGGSVHYQQTPLGVYWSNGDRCGKVAADETTHAWGVELVPSFGLVVLGTGGLEAGTYGVSLAFANVALEEGAATATQFIDVPDGGGIQVGGIPAPMDADTSEVRVYVTTANGTELQYAGSAPGGASSYVIDAGRRGRQLGATQFCVPYPPVLFPRLKAGRLIGAQGTYFVWSEPLYYGLFNPLKNFIRLHGEPITMVAVPDSESFVVYLGTDTHTYVLRGESIDTARVSIASHIGVIPGSMTVIQPDALGLDFVTQPVPVWVDKRGVPMVGAVESMVPLSDKFVYPLFDSASAFFSQREGMSRYIVSGRGGAAPGLAVSDSVVAHVNVMGSAS